MACWRHSWSTSREPILCEGVESSSRCQICIESETSVGHCVSKRTQGAGEKRGGNRSSPTYHHSPWLTVALIQPVFATLGSIWLLFGSSREVHSYQGTEQRSHWTTSCGFSWGILDFGNQQAQRIHHFGRRNGSWSGRSRAAIMQSRQGGMCVELRSYTWVPSWYFRVPQWLWMDKGSDPYLWKVLLPRI